MQLTKEEQEFILQRRKTGNSIICDFCKDSVVDIYYKCLKHNKTYCYNCARNGAQYKDNEIDYNDAKVCDNYNKYQNCILTKFVTNENE